MTTLGQFGRQAPNQVFFSIVLGAIAGIAYAALIPILLTAALPSVSELVPVESVPFTLFGYEIAHPRTAALFVSLCLLIWGCRSLSQILLMRVSIEISRVMRMDIYEKVSRTSIAHLERVGLERISTALTTDINRIVTGARATPALVIHSITITGILGFLFYLSSSIFWFTLGVIGAGALTYQLPVWFANRFSIKVRHYADLRAEGVRGLVRGAKELKLNGRKRKHFFEEVLNHNEIVSGELEAKGVAIVIAAVSYGDLINMTAIGAVAFVLVNYRAIGQSELVGVMMALLYLTGPVAAILASIPTLMLASNSSKEIAKLCAELPQETTPHADRAISQWQRLKFDNVFFSHLDSGDGRRFSVGPISFELERGQITFIVGGNGSGKSTIAKLITLHYLPDGGTISFDGRRIVPANITSYREEISAIYSDYHLFDRLFGVLDSEKAKITTYLRQLALEHKVKIEDGRFSTLSISDGQRRRLALLAAFLEDRSLYLFDEWAADQDPEFKGFFYEFLLPQLRERGKCVVVISHDDRYFNAADRLLFIEDGKVRATPPDPTISTPI